MDDGSLVRRLLEIGVAARRRNPEAYARPSDDVELRSVGAARIANWLEALGGHRMIGDVQPCFTSSGAGFEFQVTEEALQVSSDTSRFAAWLNAVVPSAPEFDVFISYAAGDTGIADELRGDLERNGLRCFMAEKDIQIATEWQDSIRKALMGSKRILVLLTPRSINRPWVLMETGAAWALGKPLIPALSHVAPNELLDPIRRYQGRVIETTAQRQALVQELIGT
jgi:TIR domain